MTRPEHILEQAMRRLDTDQLVSIALSAARWQVAFDGRTFNLGNAGAASNLARTHGGQLLATVGDRTVVVANRPDMPPSPGSAS